MADVKKLLAALSGQESSGNAQAYNPLGLAMGKYQFQQGTWDGAARMAKREDLVGVDPREVSEIDQDQVAETYANYLLEKSGGDIGYVSAAWYAGEGNADEYSRQGRYPTLREAGNHPSVAEYVQKVTQRYNDGSYALDGVFDRSTDPFGAKKPVIPTLEPIPNTFLSMTKDRFLGSWNDSGLGGIARNVWAYHSTGGSDRGSLPGMYRITQEDVDYVTKALPGDYVAQKWVLMNASGPDHLGRLVLMKQEDSIRRARIEGFKSGLASTLSHIGTIGGSLLSDPTVLLPLGQQAFIARTLGRLGVIGEKLALSKIVRYSEFAATNAALNVGERKFAEAYGGYQQDLTSAALVGGIAGAGLGVFGDIFKRSHNKGTQKTIAAFDNAESHAIAQAAGIDLPSQVKALIKEDLSKLHDSSFVKSIPSETLSKLSESGKVFAVSKGDIQTLLRRIGAELPENSRAFYKPDEDITVIIKDALKPGDNIDNILAHEVGVHAGLKNTLGDSLYAEIQDAVMKRIEKPKGDWLDAVRAVPSGGWEEVLGHWIERGTQKDPIFRDLIKGVKTALRSLGINAELSDTEIKDFVKRSVENEIEKAQGYRLLSDGSAVVNGLKFSASNVFNPSLLSHVLDLEAPRVGLAEKAKGLVSDISRWSEAGWLYATPHGVLSNSKSKTAQQFAADVLHDPRMRTFKGTLAQPIEKQKERIQRRLSEYWGGYMDIRSKHMLDTITTDGLPSPARMQEFNKQVRECFNATYTDNTSGLLSKTWHPDVIRAAQEVKKLRDDMIDIGKKSGVKGKTLIDQDWKALDEELWRKLDDDKYLTFISKFPSYEKATEFLTEYAKTAVKRDKVEQKLLAEKTKEYKKALEEWHEKVNALPEGEKKPRRPNRPIVKPQEVDEWIDKEARDWAYGITDQNLSNLDVLKHEELPGLTDSLSFMRERFPMDTSKIVKTPWGEPFSYDIHLRSDDLDRIIPKVINRFSGEAALRNRFVSAEELTNVRAKIASDLARAERVKEISPSEVKRDLGAFDETICQLQGFRRAEDVRSQAQALVQTLKGLSYAQNGANMGANQLGEISGSLAYIGGRAVFHLIPAVQNFITALRHGDNAAKIVKEAEAQAFGATIDNRIWSSDFSSRVWKEASTKADVLRHMDSVGTATNFLGRATSTVNLLPKLTDNMLRGARRDTIWDTIEWAEGKEFSAWRNPFSEKKLAAVGLNEEGAEALKADLKKYLQCDPQGKPLSLNLSKWQEESKDTFYKWQFLVDNQAMRAIQQHTIGNKSLLADSSSFTRMMFQFKDFSMKVMNGQLTRIMTHRELDDIKALLFSMGSNMMVYAGLTYARAQAYFPDDQGKQQAYLEKRLAWEELAKAAFFRSMVGSALSFGQDIYEAATGSQSFRTTVDRTAQFNKGQPERDLGDAVGDFITQFPAVRTAKSVAYDAPLTAYKALMEEQITKRDLRSLFKAFPLQNFLPLVYFNETLIDESGLPEKTRRR